MKRIVDTRFASGRVDRVLHVVLAWNDGTRRFGAATLLLMSRASPN